MEPRRLVSEAQWLETIAARHGLPDGNVGRAAFNTEEAAHTIAQQSESPLTRNIRNKSHEEAWRAMGNAALRTTHSGRLRISATARSVVRSPHAVAAPQSAEVERDFPRTQRVIDYTGPLADRNREGLRLAPDEVGVDRHLFAVTFRWIAGWRRTTPWRRS